ncbi:MAG: polysulfide reductase NrfD [Coriobacteriales bacterium]|jgi:formate-dependent nitrite reductase membrane component NrfD|nr:polysulfide reductase NrfD [Coriobacteriales bacterium]
MFSQAVFSQNVVWYLFLAGAGGGLAFVVFLLDSFLRYWRPWLFGQYRVLMVPALFTGIAFVALGTVFLLFDLGRPERILSFVTDLRPNTLTLGAWSIVAFLALSALQLLVRLRFAAATPKPVHIAIRWATAAGAASVMVYTGLLFQSFGALHFLASPLLPLLFVLSSLSCGFALLLLIGFLRQPEGLSLRPSVRLTRAHLPLLILELVVLAGYLLLMAFGTQTAAASTARLLNGDYALAFWGGVVALGLLLPLGMELILRGHASWNSTAVYALACLGGALALRFCFLAAAAHPDVGLGPPLI